MMFGGYFAPVALTMAFESVNGYSALDASGAFAVGAAGFLLGVGTHTAANVIMAGKNIGMTRGAQIVRRAQATAYALPVSAALIFNAVYSYGDNGKESEPHSSGMVHMNPGDSGNNSPALTIAR